MCPVDEERSHRRWSPSQRWPLVLLTLTGVVAGSGAGLLVGLIADSLRGRTSHWVPAVILLTMGMYEVLGRRAPLTHVGRETPRLWAERRPAQWAVLTGAVLGTGVLTRIGVALWYVLPLSALLVRGPTEVVLVFAVYAGVRNGLAIAVSMAYARRDALTVADWLTSRMAMARQVSGYSCVAAAVAIAQGFL